MASACTISSNSSAKVFWNCYGPLELQAEENWTCPCFLIKKLLTLPDFGWYPALCYCPESSLHLLFPMKFDDIYEYWVVPQVGAPPNISCTIFLPQALNTAYICIWVVPGSKINHANVKVVAVWTGPHTEEVS